MHAHTHTCPRIDVLSSLSDLHYRQVCSSSHSVIRLWVAQPLEYFVLWISQRSVQIAASGRLCAREVVTSKLGLQSLVGSHLAILVQNKLLRCPSCYCKGGELLRNSDVERSGYLYKEVGKWRPPMYVVDLTEDYLKNWQPSTYLGG